ncbi:hypothetical protein L3Q82_000591 [Scortum barcoo]|uniref:Uncharacterized protein n=1 Tax=Scortum barcoo TaxID=214431 RepID=A0ACB8WFF3_9TELE|nr:hypothetical protein L3Q82_000591 [Scortum barcoo]
MADETSSIKTRSRISVQSSTSSTASAAAKARLSYAEEEIQLRLEQAKLKASMEMLSYKKETAAAIAEALDAAVEASNEKHSCKLDFEPTHLETTQRTEQYIIDQAKTKETEFQQCDDQHPVKTDPNAACNTPPSHLKPEAKPFLPDRTITASQSPHLKPQQPYVSHVGRTNNDNQVAPSIQDASFMKIMDQGLRKDSNNSRVAPLPFECPRPRLPNNRPQALKRLMSLRRNFERKPDMKVHFLNFMDKMLENHHAEIAPSITEKEERWYLPIFGVYHPKKPKKIRVVFDSSTQYNGVSLNDVLLTGPDLNNTLLGVLIRFRKEAIAFTADIEQMFYCFLVREEDRNFLRFLWFQDNDPSKDIVDYRMRVHVFGNSPSPAVAIHGLYQSVQDPELNADPDVKSFVMRDFYVDDGLKSLPTVKAVVIDLLKKTQDTLSKSNLRLHKIAANNKEVMDAFPPEDHANDLIDLDFEADTLPVQRSLGFNWNLRTDCFLFSISDEVKPFTRRGVLSTINSLYDPLGFVAPVTIQGKAILRELTAENGDWDAPLPPEMEEAWMLWRASLSELASLSIFRPYTIISPSTAVKKELHVFSDASIKAIATVAYLRLTDADGNNDVGFVMGKAKLTPRPEHTVPRLELCAAVLASELTELISAELDLQLDAITYYTDSKVVLGYIHNETRRFYVYVSNRVLRIRRSSHPNQWRYVSSEENPADHATRSVTASRLKDTNWLMGPKFLPTPGPDNTQDTHQLVDPSSDPDIRPLVSSLATTSSCKHLGSQQFAKFSSWKSLTRAVAHLIHIARLFNKKLSQRSSCKGWHYCRGDITLDEFNQASATIIQTVQMEAYSQEIKCTLKKENIPKNSPLYNLDPFVDAHGLLRVGGRLHNSSLDQDEKTPLIIPGKHHIAALLIRHYHEQIHHQPRHFTEGAVRSAGFWIVGGKRKAVQRRSPHNALDHNARCIPLKCLISTSEKMQCIKIKGKTYGIHENYLSRLSVVYTARASVS